MCVLTHPLSHVLMLFALICLIFSDDDDDIWPAGVEANQLQKKNAAAKKTIGGLAQELVETIGGPCRKNSRSAPKKFAAAKKKNWRSLGSKRPSAKKIGGLPNLNAACQKKTRFAKTLVFKNSRPPKKKFAASEKKFAVEPKKIRGLILVRGKKKTRPPKKKTRFAVAAFAAVAACVIFCIIVAVRCGQVCSDCTAAHCVVFGCFCC